MHLLEQKKKLHITTFLRVKHAVDLALELVPAHKRVQLAMDQVKCTSSKDFSCIRRHAPAAQEKDLLYQLLVQAVTANHVFNNMINSPSISLEAFLTMLNYAGAKQQM